MIKAKIRKGVVILSAGAKERVIGVIGAVLLVLFTLYALLDTFVIERSYGTAAVSPTYEVSTATAAVPDEGADGSEKAISASSPVVTENSYSDGEISITLSEYRAYDTAIYVADVTLSSPDQILSAFADNVYGRNVKDETSSIAADNGAILAINGDFYGSRNSGYVIRNGVLYRNVPAGNEDLVIWSDGEFGFINERDVSAEELLSNGAYQVFSFGPALVSDGCIAVTEGEEVGRAKASNPRTAIAVVDDLHYLFIVSDGRTDESEGLTLSELAEFALTLGAQDCYNLDGGGSSTMYFNGKVVNNPTTSGNGTKERSVSDIVYVANY